MPSNSKIVATCKGKACGKKKITQTVKNAFGTVSPREVPSEPSGRLDVITVLVSKPGAINASSRLIKIRAAKKPHDHHQVPQPAPGGQAPVAC